MLSVYADLYFLMNWMIDSILLYSAARLANHRVLPWRIMVASGIGAGYATAGLWIYESSSAFVSIFYSPYGKIVFSLLMIFLAFYPVNTRKLLSLALYSYATAALVAGTSIAFSLFGARTWMSSWARWQGIPWWWVVIIAAVAGFYLHRLWHWATERQLREKNVYRVEIVWQGGHCSFEGLVDTGHQLRDPITNKPVLVIELHLLREWLPAKLIGALQSRETDWSQVMDSLQDVRWFNKVKILPFQSLGQSNGVLLGVRVDMLRLLKNHPEDCEITEWHDVTVALYPGKLSSDGQFHALLHPELLRGDTKHRSQPAVQ